MALPSGPLQAGAQHGAEEGRLRQDVWQDSEAKTRVWGLGSGLYPQQGASKGREEREQFRQCVTWMMFSPYLAIARFFSNLVFYYCLSSFVEIGVDYLKASHLAPISQFFM